MFLRKGFQLLSLICDRFRVEELQLVTVKGIDKKYTGLKKRVVVGLTGRPSKDQTVIDYLYLDNS